LQAEHQEITISRSIRSSPSRVYQAFTSADGWCEWCCETAECDPVIGGKLHIYTEGYNAYGEFTKLYQDRAAAFTWNGDREPSMRIRVSVEGMEYCTQLTFKVQVLGTEQEYKDIAEFLERIWGHVLDNLKAVLEK
jgi:uncharacterized protein YndB with AHSA1/START domain